MTNELTFFSVSPRISYFKYNRGRRSSEKEQRVNSDEQGWFVIYDVTKDNKVANYKVCVNPTTAYKVLFIYDYDT